MVKIKYIQTPLCNKIIKSLNAGDEVVLSGVVYTARDQAHLRLAKMIENKKKLPFNLKGQVIYYCGPTPMVRGVIGSCGPTTSMRMDIFTPALLSAGLKGMIGKGRRTCEVRREIKRFNAVYFLAPAGAGAYLRTRVKSCEIAAFKDLGPEAVYKLEVKDFPLIIGIDSEGMDIYNQ